MRQESSTTVAKQFGTYARIAQHEAVEVTSHNRPYVVIISAQEHERLRRLDRLAMSSADLPDDLRDAIEKASPSATAHTFDHEAVE